MKIRLAVALLATILSVLTGAPAPAQAGGPPLLTMTFNACGNVCRHGEVRTTAANIAYQVRARNVSILMLQELCYSQFLGVRSRLAPYGYHAAFAAQTRGGHCDDRDKAHGKGFGVALVAKGKLGGVAVHRLPSPSAINPEHRVALSASVRLSGRTLLAVTTHTAPSGPNLVAQMASIDRWLWPLAATRPVLFGGDLNSMPNSPALDDFYASFHEANGGRTGTLNTFITYPRKIDYLFASNDYFARRGVGTACGPYSDHCMYFGRFQ
jgi:endonuclease/exonuclease/phosphatase family metal-dependent hydrolase